MLALLVALIAIAAVVVVMVRAGNGHQAEPSPSTVEPSALAVWWSSATESVTDLQTALDDSQIALQRIDNSRLEAACQTVHDVARVDLQALMPSPDRNLTAELAAAIEDAHTAAHMCLSVIARSSNNYSGEFVTNIEQAGKHLELAQAIVNRALTGA